MARLVHVQAPASRERYAGAAGGGSGVSAFKHLSHSFVVVAGAPQDGVAQSLPREYIVDPRFREQFVIPQACPPLPPFPPRPLPTCVLSSPQQVKVEIRRHRLITQLSTLCVWS